VVVDNFNPVRVAILPAKTNTVLVVDTDAVLAFALARESLQSVAWWYPQIMQISRVVQIA
jgi:hypothetical protein